MINRFFYFYISVFMPNGLVSKRNLCAIHGASGLLPKLRPCAEALPSSLHDKHKYRVPVSILRLPKRVHGLGVPA